VPILTNLSVPHGVAFAGDVMYVAETHRILRLPIWWDGKSAQEIAQLPGGEHHATRTLAVGPDNALYASIGSSCDVCVERDPQRATVWRFELDGSGGAPFARGLRNAVGLAWEPATGRLWVTDNERNELGEDIPPDELDVLRAGGDYGWPACWGQRTVHPGFGSPERCAGTEPPALELPAHSAPLGLAFYTGDRFPPEYQGGLFVALHGSALRENAVGYNVLYVPVENGQPGTPREFARGWLVGDDSWGRPVAPFVSRDGSLYVTDDKAGAVYRIRPSAVASGRPG
jgi:glucose/arabinose dehydrogenase